jgi:hypothetical protein
MSIYLWVGAFSGEERSTHRNLILEAAGLPLHQEPEEPANGAPWHWEIGGYGCFYQLRRVAAYAALDEGLPKPTMDFEKVWDDPVLQRYYRQFKVKKPPSGRRLAVKEGAAAPPSSFVSRLGSPFAHLMHHPAEFGDYLPLPFDELVVAHPPLSDWCEPTGIGSSYALQRECLVLAEHLQFPSDIPLEELDRLRLRAEELLDEPGWERFALECFVCKALLTGAEISIRSGCALTFG